MISGKSEEFTAFCTMQWALIRFDWATGERNGRAILMRASFSLDGINYNFEVRLVYSLWVFLKNLNFDSVTHR